MGVAPSTLLLRRVYLDLIGLPPTAAELDQFQHDLRPDAYERVVDQLLERHEYGQRWARHWMDVWRYSDWYGLGEQIRNSQQHIWHWRDWIVDSLNADKGYDQMVLEMLAGDELAPNRPRCRARHRFFGAAILSVQSDNVAGRDARAHIQGISGINGQLHEVPRPQIRSD